LKHKGKARLLLAVLICCIAAPGFLPFAEKMPAQPIDFSHAKHAGDNRIPCQYCHTSARRSPASGIPSVERCLGCHRVVAVDKGEIQKLRGYYDREESIPWVRIHKLPDFVYFRHYAHVLSDIQCQTCHGEVEKIDRFRERPFLEMGWCLECHREQERVAEIQDCYACHR